MSPISFQSYWLRVFRLDIENGPRTRLLARDWTQSQVSLRGSGQEWVFLLSPSRQKVCFLVLNNSSEYSTFLELLGGVLDDATLRIDRLQ